MKTAFIATHSLLSAIHEAQHTTNGRVLCRTRVVGAKAPRFHYTGHWNVNACVERIALLRKFGWIINA